MPGNKREGDMLAGVAHDSAAKEGRAPHALIESDRVQGTDVFNCSGERIGAITRFFIEKQSGRARYAEMEFGGFLGFGTDKHPLPWEVLDYDVVKGGYVVNLTKEQLRDGPRYSEDERRRIDEIYNSEIRSYYGVA